MKVRRLRELYAGRDGGMVRHVHEEHLEKAHFKNRADFERRLFLDEILNKELQVQMTAAYAEGNLHRKGRKSAFLDKRAVLLPQQKDAESIHPFLQRIVKQKKVPRVSGCRA